MSRVAVTITALADDSVELDNVEQLLVNLKRKVYSVNLKFYSFRDVTSANKSTFIKSHCMSFDPFGDFDTAGYLQNALQLKEPEEVKRVEHLALKQALKSHSTT